VEFDFLGEENKVVYVVEIKWRNKPASYRDVANFVDKVKKAGIDAVKLYFISKSGFTKQADELMKMEGVMDISNEFNQ